MGASAKQTGPSQAEPVVSALRASVPCAWQPIETAPEDTDLIVFGRGEVTAAFKDCSGEWCFLGDDYVSSGDWLTHWMPLPAPPVELGAAFPRIPDADETYVLR